MLWQRSQRPKKAGTNERTKTRKAERENLPLDSGAGRSSGLGLGAGRLARGQKSDPAAAAHMVVVFDQETRNQACLVSSKGPAVVGRGRQQAPHVDRQQCITRTNCRATKSHRGSDSLREEHDRFIAEREASQSNQEFRSAARHRNSAIRQTAWADTKSRKSLRCFWFRLEGFSTGFRRRSC